MWAPVVGAGVSVGSAAGAISEVVKVAAGFSAAEQAEMRRIIRKNGIAVFLSA